MCKCQFCLIDETGKKWIETGQKEWYMVHGLSCGCIIHRVKEIINLKIVQQILVITRKIVIVIYAKNILKVLSFNVKVFNVKVF